MPNKPLVTIVIPVYNRISLLYNAVESIVKQTYTNWELIITDDGSTDGTAEWVRSIPDSRVRLLQLSHSGHIGSVRNMGVRAGSGEWVAFLDSDDVWMPEKLALQLYALEKSGTRWCYGKFELMNESGQTVPSKWGAYRSISGWIIKQLLTTAASVFIGSVMVHRSLFEEVNGFSADPRLLYRGDYELALRLALRAEVISLPDILVRVLEHGGRSTNKIKDSYERTALVYTIFLDGGPEKELKKIARKRRAHELALAASWRLGCGHDALALKYFARSFAGGAGWKQLFSGMYNGIKTRMHIKK